MWNTFGFVKVVLGQQSIIEERVLMLSIYFEKIQAESCPSQIHMLMFQPLVPQYTPLFGDRAFGFEEVI